MSAMSVTEFCQSQGIARGTWYNLLARGEAPEHFNIGRRVVIPVAAIERWQARMIAESKAAAN